MKKKTTNVFICKDNYIIEPIRKDIELVWDEKYLGREIIEEKYDDCFPYGKYYIENESYSYSGTECYIAPILHDGRIEQIESEKYEDHSPAHGRPITYDKDLTKTDIKEFSKVLDEVTIDPISKEYESLVSALQEKKELGNGFVFVERNKKGIVVAQNDQPKVCIPEKELKNVLMYSHSYVDILCDEDTMREAKSIIKEKDIPAIKAIMSVVDYSRYDNLDNLKKMAADRALFRNFETGYANLMDGVVSDDLKKVEDNLSYARLYIQSDGSTATSPFLIAVKHNNYEIAKALAENGAFTCERIIHNRYSNDVINETPIYEAYLSGNSKLFDLVIKHHGLEEFHANVSELAYKNHDIDSIKKILEAGGEVSLYFADESILTDEDLVALANIKNARIKWSDAFMKRAYKLDEKLCFKMIDQDRYDPFEKVFAEVNNLELFERCLQNKESISLDQPQYDLIFERGGKWHELTKKKLLEGKYTASNYGYHLGDYLGDLVKDDKFGEFMQAIERLQITELPKETFYPFGKYSEVPDHEKKLKMLEEVNDTLKKKGKES